MNDSLWTVSIWTLGLVFLCLAILGGCVPTINKETLIQATTMAVSSACDGMADKECVAAIADNICEGTDSVKECLARYAALRP